MPSSSDAPDFHRVGIALGIVEPAGGRDVAGVVPLATPAAASAVEPSALGRQRTPTAIGDAGARRIELAALRADGSEFPVEPAVTRIPTDGPPPCAWTSSTGCGPASSSRSPTTSGRR